MNVRIDDSLPGFAAHFPVSRLTKFILTEKHRAADQ